MIFRILILGAEIFPTPGKKRKLGEDSVIMALATKALATMKTLKNRSPLKARSNCQGRIALVALTVTRRKFWETPTSPPWLGNR